MKIVLTEYNPQWPKVFETEKQILLRHLPSADMVIEHIGSTSVPDLIAKPIIDIMIGLSSFDGADSLVPHIQKLGYRYFPEYEDVMPFRRFFKKQDRSIDMITHHIHMVELDSEFWIRHLLFRDYLRNNPSVASDYAELKCSLAEKNWNHTNDYSDAKTDFIRGIEKQAAQGKIR